MSLLRENYFHDVQGKMVDKKTPHCPADGIGEKMISLQMGLFAYF